MLGHGDAAGDEAFKSTELQIARYLRGRGHEVLAVLRDPGSKVRVGDAYVDGKRAEFKTPDAGEPSGSARCRRSAMAALGLQAGTR